MRLNAFHGSIGGPSFTPKRLGNPRGNHYGNRRGAVMVYSVAIMVVFVAICSLAVDYGRVQLTKTELQSAADAAARAGAAGLYDGTAVTRAVDCARYNVADGTPVD